MNKKMDIHQVASSLASKKVVRAGARAEDKKDDGAKPEAKSEEVSAKAKAKAEDSSDSKAEDGEEEQIDAGDDATMTDADFAAKARELLEAEDNDEALGLLAASLEALKAMKDGEAKSEEDSKEAEARSLVNQAMASGRITPAGEASAMDLGRTSPRALRKFLETQPPKVFTRGTANVEVVSQARAQKAGTVPTAEEIATGLKYGLTVEQLTAAAAKRGV